MNAETWEKIKIELSSPFGTVDLKIDGYDVALRISRINPLRYVIAVFVNGHFLGRWMNIERGDEEGRRFFPTCTRKLYRGKYRARLEQIAQDYGKRAAKETGLNDALNKTITHRRAYWSSVDALRRHFVKHNNSIELVRIGYAASA